MTLHKCCTFNVTRFRCVEYQKAKRAVVSDCIIVINQRLLAKSGCHSENCCYKEQLLSNFNLENSVNFGQFFKNVRATSLNIWSNLWLRLLVPM